MRRFTQLMMVAGAILLTAGLSWVLASQLAKPIDDVPVASADTAPQGPLKVTVVLTRDTCRAGESIPARFCVANVSEGPQTMRLWNCAWSNHWSFDSRDIQMSSWDCPMNFLETETLAPGETYERSTELYISEHTPPGMLTFKAAFTPIGMASTWSGDLTIRVTRAKR